MEELLRQILEELKFQSKQIEKLTLVTAGLKQPCGKGAKDIRKILDSMDSMPGMKGMKDNPMKPMMDHLMKMVDDVTGGEKDGS